MFQVKLASGDDNANSILIWPYHLFQHENVKVPFCQNTSVEVLKICYRYTFVEFVIVQVSVLETHNMLPIYYY